MTTNVNVDPLRAHAVWKAWEKPFDYHKPSDYVKMVGHDLLDGAAFSLLKAEFLAAQAGVVPFVPLPGGGQGVMTVGAALSQPKARWPQPQLHDLYLINHRGMATIHNAVRPGRPSTPELSIPFSDEINEEMALAQFWNDASAQKMAAIQAWVILAAVGVLATIATSYYATRTKVEAIQTDAHLLQNQHKIGMLTDLAQQQLLQKGKIDDNLISAINQTGGTKADVWPYVAIGAGGLIAGATGFYALSQRRGRR